MGRIFKIKGSYSFEWSKIKHDISFEGYISEENNLFRGYCTQTVDGSTKEMRGIIGAFSKDDNDRVGMSFAIMPYAVEEYEAVITTPDITKRELAMWGVPYSGKIRYLGHVSLNLEGTESSESILKKYNNCRVKNDFRFECYEDVADSYFKKEIDLYPEKSKKTIDDTLFENVMYKYDEAGVFSGKWPF